MSGYKKYSDELLTSLVVNARSVRDVLTALGIERSGSSHTNISNRIKVMGLDTSHFSRNGSYKVRRPSSDHFVIMPPGSHRQSPRTLRRAMIEDGVEPICAICGIDKWLGNDIILDIDHVNGDWHDNRRNNLRFLCPNCHRQTETRTKPKTLVTVKLCGCGAEIHYRSKRCRKCSSMNRPTKIDWPKRELLVALVKENGLRGTGRLLGVSDGAVKKHLPL